MLYISVLANLIIGTDLPHGLLYFTEFTYGDGTVGTWFQCAEVFGQPTFYLVLATAHWYRTCNVTVFLDIACISQDDEVTKARGINALGAILDRSENMLGLVSEGKRCYWSCQVPAIRHQY